MNPFSFSPTAGISLFCGLGLDKNFNNRVRLVHFFNRDTFQVLDGKPGNGNGNNKDNTGSGNKGNGNGNKKGAVAAIADFFTGEEPEAGKLGAGVSQALVEHLFSEEILGGLAEGLGIQEETVTAQEETGTDSSDTANADYGQTMTATPSNAAPGAVSPGNAAASYAGKNDNGNNGNGGNGNHYGWGNGNNGNGNGNNGNGNGNSSNGGTNDNNGNASGNTNNTGGSQNQSGILFPADGEVSELEQELIDMIKTTGKQKNYELVEYVNDVNRDHAEVLMELNINGIMDTAYSYGIFPEKAGGRQEQTPGINLHRQTSGKYRIWNVKEPHGIPGAGEKNRGRNCLKAAVGTLIMEKRTAEKGTPFVLFLRLYLRVELPNLPRSVRFFQRRDGKGAKSIRVECQCQGGKRNSVKI